MSKIIAELLGIQGDQLKNYIERLEHVSLRPGVDVRLGVEVVTQTRTKVKALKLDINDTTAKELFFGLKHRLAHDDGELVKKLDLQPKQIEQNTEKIAAACQNISGRETSLSLTAAGTKRILKAVPPKRTLKALKYRSLDSVLKRQDPRVLYALAAMIENDSWHAQVYAKIRRLNAKDIQWQPVACLPVPEKWYKRLQPILSSKGALVVNDEAGVVCLLPVVEVQKSGSSVLLLGLALQAVTHIATQSLPYRKQALTEGYGNIVPRIAIAEHPTLMAIHGLLPTWRTVHELAGKGHISFASQESEFEVFDLFWESTETKLAAIVPDMDFWVGTHYLGTKTTKGNPVSLHVLDVAIALVSEAPYGEQPYAHLRSSLWNELQLRYLREDALNRSLIDQLSTVTGGMVP